MTENKTSNNTENKPADIIIANTIDSTRTATVVIENKTNNIENKQTDNKNDAIEYNVVRFDVRGTIITTGLWRFKNSDLIKKLLPVTNIKKEYVSDKQLLNETIRDKVIITTPIVLPVNIFVDADPSDFHKFIDAISDSVDVVYELPLRQLCKIAKIWKSFFNDDSKIYNLIREKSQAELYARYPSSKKMYY
jgi:hypothetical protein